MVFTLLFLQIGKNGVQSSLLSKKCYMYPAGDSVCSRVVGGFVIQRHILEPLSFCLAMHFEVQPFGGNFRLSAFNLSTVHLGIVSVKKILKLPFQMIYTTRGVNADRYYLVLYSIELKTLSFSPLD